MGYWHGAGNGPIILFPHRGGVPKGKSFVHTTRLVDTGIYSVVRHPQYLGGILSIFVATLLLYPHWLFVILGIPGAAILYWSAKEEDKNLVQQFGNDYLAYIKRVPSMMPAHFPEASGPMERKKSSRSRHSVSLRRKKNPIKSSSGC